MVVSAVLHEPSRILSPLRLILRYDERQKLIREKSEEAIRRVERETCREAGLTSAGEAVKRTISALTGLVVFYLSAWGGNV